MKKLQLLVALTFCSLLSQAATEENMELIEEQKAVLPSCYTFSYERQCMDAGACIEYTICGEGSNFSAIWQEHLRTQEWLAERDCGAIDWID